MITPYFFETFPLVFLNTIFLLIFTLSVFYLSSKHWSYPYFVLSPLFSFLSNHSVSGFISSNGSKYHLYADDSSNDAKKTLNFRYMYIPAHLKSPLGYLINISNMTHVNRT